MLSSALRLRLRLLVFVPVLLYAAAAFPQTRTITLTLPKEADKSIRQIASEFADAVEKRSHGALIIDLGQRSQVWRDSEIVSAVSAGAIEIAGTTLNQFVYDVPLAGVFFQPFMFNFNALVRAAASADSEVRTLIDEEILYWTSTRVLWWQPNGASVILARQAPADLTAIANMPVGAPDEPSKAFARACGGTVYLTPTEGLRGALQAGTVQLAFTDILAAASYDLWDVAQAVINTRHAPSLYIVVINERLWLSLGVEEQQILTEAARDLQDQIWDRYLQIEADAYAKVKAHGMKVYDLAPADVEAWRICSSPMLEAYAERIGEPGEKMFAAYGKLRADPCCRQVPEASLGAPSAR